ncbi:MAG TPA: cytochrome c biogenesis protein CcdA, partial [Oscillospiraceae bacterium]|nr:cytochrome c biogenesis protein CcdA [Oscillospiraceae bacterium]
NYLVTFLEGLISFISPCILPLIPVYIMYFAGNGIESKKSKVILNAVGFVLGFTIFFILLGVFASAVGSFLIEYKTALNIVTGAIVVLFGLNYIGLIKISALNSNSKLKTEIKPNNFLKSILFGAVFSIGWTPCTGAFLGSALMMASQQSKWFEGMTLLLAYSLGLGMPFIISAVLIDSLKNAFNFIKRYYRAINIVCGLFLIFVGILMMAGIFSKIALFLN